MIKTVCAAGYMLVAALFTMPGCWKSENPKTDNGPPPETLHHSLVGKRAPEIVGATLEGKPLKLSDQRGKVVLLNFWFFG